VKARLLIFAVRAWPWTGLGYSWRHAVGRRLVRALDREALR
jgi:hypothetical protein